MPVVSEEKVLDSCSFHDEEDGCTYHYTVEVNKDPSVKELMVEMLEKKGELRAGYILIRKVYDVYSSFFKLEYNERYEQHK